MWHEFFAGFRLIHGILLLVAAVGLFKFWRRSGFWLPTYIHIMAGIGFVITYWALSATPPDAPASKYGPLVRLLIALILPAIIYFFFIIYGGQRVAFRRSFPKKSCPFCQGLVEVLPEDIHAPGVGTRFAERECPHCGQALT